MATIALCLCLLDRAPIIDRGDLMDPGPTIEHTGEWLDPRPVEQWKDDEDE